MHNNLISQRVYARNPLLHTTLSSISFSLPHSLLLITLAGSLIFTELILFGWVETKRLYDLRNPGSQGDGSFLGITDGLKGKENGYPGVCLAV